MRTIKKTIQFLVKRLTRVNVIRCKHEMFCAHIDRGKKLLL